MNLFFFFCERLLHYKPSEAKSVERNRTIEAANLKLLVLLNNAYRSFKIHLLTNS